jgi:predicted amidohydrolase YtcJ
MLPRIQHDPELAKALTEEAARQNLQVPQQAVIFFGGTIYPDPEQPGLTVEALGIADGVVIASGSLEDVREAMTSYRPADQPLTGEQTLLPGLIDPHAHLLSSAMILDWTDLSPISHQRLDTEYSFEQIKRKLVTAANLIKDKPEKEQWVLGYGVDPSLMASWTDFNAQMIDDITLPIKSTIKVFLLNASGHISYINTAAWAAAKLPDEFKTGVLTEEQSSQMLAVIPQADEKQIRINLGEIFREANQCGITTVFDASVGLFQKAYEVQRLNDMEATGQLTLRVGGALYGSNEDLPIWLTDAYSPQLDSDGNTLFTLRAMKLIADGSNQGLTGLQSKAYACCDEHHVPGVGAYGLYNYNPVRLLADVMVDVTARGWPILTHANGDEAITNVLSAYQLALYKVPASQGPIPIEPAWAEQRHRIEHCSLLHDDAIGLMQRMAISPSFLIGHVGYWGNAFQTTILGHERADLLDRCASALDAGLRISLHSDRFVTPFGPLRYMEQAIGRVMEANGEVLNEKECLDVNQALRAVTIDAAWQCHLDHQIGSLLKGKQADLVILAKDPLQLKDAQASGMRDTVVLQTWVSGRKVHSA